MSLEQKWRTMVGDLVAAKSDFVRLESDFEAGVIHFLDEKGKPLVLPVSLSGDYWNILEFSKEIFSDELIKEPSAAVLFRDCDSEKSLRLCKKIYFSPSTNLIERKKDIFMTNPEVQVNFGVDPYSLGLWESGILKSSVPPDFLSAGQSGKLELEKKIENQSKNSSCGLKVFRFSSLAFDLAGAGSIQQLAIVIAAFVQLVEDSRGLWDPEYLFKVSSFEISLNSHLFLGVVKIKSLRLLIKKMTSTYGLKQIYSPVFTIPSPRYLSTREPHNNLLRLATMNMAAIQGGADGFVNLAYDLYSHNKGGVLSRNMDLLLRKESSLPNVGVPFLGSYSMDSLVESMCDRAWSFFQGIMSKGGLCQSLRSGWLQDEIKRENDEEICSFKNRKQKMTGVNEFVLFRSLSSEHPLVERGDAHDIESWWSEWVFKEDSKKLCDVRRLVPVQISRSFEDWQFRADALRKKSPDKVCLRVFVESGLENSQSWKKLVEIFSLGGLGVSSHPDESCHPLVFIILAFDPEGSFSREKLKNLNSGQKLLCLWVGENKPEGFDDFIGESSDRDSLFKKVFNVLEKT